VILVVDASVAIKWFFRDRPNGHGKNAAPDDELAMPVSLSPTLSRKRVRGQWIAARVSR